jgi:hypothetical protein
VYRLTQKGQHLKKSHKFSDKEIKLADMKDLSDAKIWQTLCQNLRPNGDVPPLCICQVALREFLELEQPRRAWICGCHAPGQRHRISDTDTGESAGEGESEGEGKHKGTGDPRGSEDLQDIRDMLDEAKKPTE